MKILTNKVKWKKVKGLVENGLISLEYPTALMRADGLSAEGYQEVVLDENGNRQIDPTNNRILTKLVPWHDPLDWEWFSGKAPLALEEHEIVEGPIDQVQ